VEKVVAGLNARDPAPFTQAIDIDKILDAALSDMLLEPKWEAGFRKGVSGGLSAQAANQIIQQMPEGGYAKLLRMKMDGDVGKGLVRVDLGEAGSGYMDMHLLQSDDGEVRIVDWYSYATGQLYSETLRQGAASLLPTPTLLGKIYDIASNKKEHAEALVKLLGMHRRGEHEQMARKFLSLDEGLRKSRLLNIVAFQSANLSGDMKLYGKMLQNIERYFKDDESMAFVLIDYYYLEGEYDQVIATADRLQQSFGVEDANLMVIKANALLEMNRAQESAALAQRVTEFEPEYEYAYLSLLTAQVQQKQHAQAVATAKVLEQRFLYNLTPQALAENEFYADFVKSDEYRNWKSDQ
jgi:hypothetical protein